MLAYTDDVVMICCHESCIELNANTEIYSNPQSKQTRMANPKSKSLEKFEAKLLFKGDRVFKVDSVIGNKCVQLELLRQ